METCGERRQMIARRFKSQESTNVKCFTVQGSPIITKYSIYVAIYFRQLKNICFPILSGGPSSLKLKTICQLRQFFPFQYNLTFCQFKRRSTSDGGLRVRTPIPTPRVKENMHHSNLGDIRNLRPLIISVGQPLKCVDQTLDIR